MKKVVLATLGLCVLILPQIAAAKNLGANFRYTAKFICGFSSGGDSRLGIVRGHYNTTINIQAIKNKTLLAYRAAAAISDLGLELGIPSGFTDPLSFDQDGAIGLVCRDIKNLVGGGEGYIEGFVNIYSNKPLNVVSLLSGEGEGDVSVMQLLDASVRSVSESIKFDRVE